MSLYHYIASKNPLPIVERKPVDDSLIKNFYDLEEHYSINAQFEVLPCRKNPPNAAGEQIQRPYVYKVRGFHKHLNQLVEYIKRNVKEEDRVEVWSIWHGDKVPSKNMYRFNPQQITIEELQFLHDNENSCLKFFPKNKK